MLKLFFFNVTDGRQSTHHTVIGKSHITVKLWKNDYDNTCYI